MEANSLFHRNRRTLIVLIIGISALATAASVSGIFSDTGSGQYKYESIRGEVVTIYGVGIYRHMSAEVAIQGIAQDYVTLFIAVPLLMLSLYFSLKGSLGWRYILLGTLAYCFVTYLFYLVMAMYNSLFLVYAALMGTSFFAFSITAFSFELDELDLQFRPSTPTKFSGGFLIINSLCIGVLWLGVVVPPLLDGSIYPKAVEHYTTLIVQGIDLGLLLPLSFVSGYLLIRKRPLGFLVAPAYLVFLSLLMIALLAKITYMGIMGYSIIPAIFIIPLLAGISVLCVWLLLRNIETNS